MNARWAVGGLVVILIALAVWRTTVPFEPAPVPRAPESVAEEPSSPGSGAPPVSEPDEGMFGRDHGRGGPHTITGTVCDQDGVSQLSLVSVSWRQGKDSPRVLRADWEGRFRIEGLDDRDVTLTIDPSFPTQGTRSTRTVPADVGDVRLVFGRRGFATLTVVTSDGAGLSNTDLRVIGLRGDGEETLASTRNGARDLPRFLGFAPDGTLRLQVVADGYRPSRVLEFRYSRESPVQAARVVLARRTGSAAALVLVPRLENGEAPKFVRVTRRVGREWQRKTWEVCEGEVEVLLTPGEGSVEVWAARHRPTRWVPIRFDLSLESGQRTTRTMRFVRGGIVAVRGEKPGDDPLVELLRDGRPAMPWTVTEQIGAHRWRRFGPLEPGRWTLRSPVFREVDLEVRGGREYHVDLERK